MQIFKKNNLIKDNGYIQYKIIILKKENLKNKNNKYN